MEEITISKIKRNEAQAVHDAFVKSLKKDFTYFPKIATERFKEKWNVSFFRKREPIVIIAKTKSNVVGFLIANQSSAGTGVGFIQWLWVDSKYRKRGVGIRLLSAAETIFKNKGYHKMHVETSDPQNRIFYQKAGYVKEGHKRNDLWHMEFFNYGKFLTQ